MFSFVFMKLIAYFILNKQWVGPGLEAIYLRLPMAMELQITVCKDLISLQLFLFKVYIQANF